NAARRPLRAPGARQTARISNVPLRGQSVDLQAKCRRFRPMAQWKRFAFSSHPMEANCRVGRLRRAFFFAAVSLPAEPATNSPRLQAGRDAAVDVKRMPVDEG